MLSDLQSHDARLENHGCPLGMSTRHMWLVPPKPPTNTSAAVLADRMSTLETCMQEPAQGKQTKRRKGQLATHSQQSQHAAAASGTRKLPCPANATTVLEVRSTHHEHNATTRHLQVDAPGSCQ